MLVMWAGNRRLAACRCHATIGTGVFLTSTPLTSVDRLLALWIMLRMKISPAGFRVVHATRDAEMAGATKPLSFISPALGDAAWFAVPRASKMAGDSRLWRRLPVSPPIRKVIILSAGGDCFHSLNSLSAALSGN